MAELTLFGYTLFKNKPAPTEVSMVPPTDEAGSLDVFRAGAHFSSYVDFDGVGKTTSELIKRYRDTFEHADVKLAVNDIVDEAIGQLEDQDNPVKIDLQNLKVSDGLKKKVQDEFDEILRLLKFRHTAQELFRRWYVDGAIYMHKVIDTANPKKGLTDIRYIDPRKIKKLRDVVKEKDAKTGIEVIKSVNEFYIYNPQGLSVRTAVQTAQGTKIAKDAITFASSGLVDRDTNMVLSHLHPAVKNANQLRMMENAAIIYRLVRAPERRIFYVDTGNLPRLKAEEYLKDQIARFRNKVVFDPTNGQIRDDKKFMAMQEDIFIPRRQGSTGTEVDTLPGGENGGIMEELAYFQKKLYQALNVPISRLDNDGGSGLNFGKAAEISRDELKFIKFVNGLRRRFSMLFNDLLKTQLVLKNIINEDEWDARFNDLRYTWAQDAYYAMSRDQEILKSQAELATILDPLVGRYISPTYLQKRAFGMTDDEIQNINTENKINHIPVQQVLTPEPEEPTPPPKSKPSKG